MIMFTNYKHKKQEFLTSLNRDLEELLISKAEIEIKMTRAMMLYPRDEPLKEFKASYEELFKINENMFVTVLKPQEQEREDNREQNTEGNEGCMDNREQNTEGNRVVSEETILEKNDEEIMFVTQHQQHNSGETSTMLNEVFNVKETQHEATISIQSVLQAVNLENIFTEEKEKNTEQQKEEKEKNKDTGSKKIGIQKEGEIEEEKKQKLSDTGPEDIVMDKKGERLEEKNNEKVSQKIVMEKEGEQDKEKKEEEIKRIEEREQGSKSQQMSTQEESEKQIVTQESPLDHPTFKLGIPEIETPNPPRKNQTKTGPLIVKLKNKEKQVVKDKAEEKQKRTEKMSDKVKSPYVERSVDVTSGLFAIERRIGDWIFSFQGDP